MIIVIIAMTMNLHSNFEQSWPKNLMKITILDDSSSIDPTLVGRDRQGHLCAQNIVIRKVYSLVVSLFV